MANTMDNIKEDLKYCPNSGQFFWINPPKNKEVGDVVGYVTTLGYIRIYHKGKPYYAHRLAFMMMGEDIDGWEVDHIDRNKSNNKWSNLRKATSAENKYNRRGHSNSLLKIKNITLHDDGSGRLSYYVRIMKDGVVHRKSFEHTDDGLQLAIHYRDNIVSKLHGSFACTAN